MPCALCPGLRLREMDRTCALFCQFGTDYVVSAVCSRRLCGPQFELPALSITRITLSMPPKIAPHPPELGSRHGAAFETIEHAIRPQLESGDFESALPQLKQWIAENSLEARGFLLLGELYEGLEQNSNAVVALERALQLKELSAEYQPSGSLCRYQEIQSGARDNPSSPLFPGFELGVNAPGEQRALFLEQHESRKAAL